MARLRKAVAIEERNTNTPARAFCFGSHISSQFPFVIYFTAT